MKDFLGQDVQVNEYFAYPLTAGRSACMALYKLVGVLEDGVRVKAIKIESSYGFDHSWKYKTYKKSKEGVYEYRDMTDTEKHKLDNKASTLNEFSKRACKVDYKEKV